MHLIQDENGNMVGHGHSHEGHHDHDHNCHDGHCGSCESDCNKETLALLAYMVQHNEHHSAELDQMAENLKKIGMEAAAKQIKEAVSEYQKGNMRLSLALTLVKEAMKEV